MNQTLAEIISIGDELLNGQTTNTNATWMATELDTISIKTIQVTTIGDTKEAITTALQSAKERAQLVLITGGLGPTKDDITKKTISEFFNSPLVRNEEHHNTLKQLFQSFGRELNPINETQADIPACAQYIANDIGTAPGMWIEDNGTVFVSMPGVPREMKTMVSNHLIPKIKQHFTLPVIHHQFFNCVGIWESEIANILEDFENNLPSNIKLAYLPTLGIVKLRLTAFGDDLKTIKKQLEPLKAEAYSLLGEYIYSEGKLLLEEAVGNLLLEKQLTIATAESCTGGYLAHKLTSIAGSSRYFEGSVIAYSNRIKADQLGVKQETLTSFGAVSEQTVIEMAQNVRSTFNTDIGVACSGIAGPDGGTDEKPVGTVWIAYADKNTTISKLLKLRTDRSVNIQLTATAVLNLIRKTLTTSNGVKVEI